MFDKTKQVLCVMQVVEDAVSDETGLDTVMGHDANEHDYSKDAVTVKGAEAGAGTTRSTLY